ncbi:MAG: prephenate dehydrogenase, partial [Saezia sp.]
HPIAGKNLSGYQAADADLFMHAKVVLTPLEETAQTHLNNAIKVWEAIGSQVLLMKPKEHDHVLGAVSHFPHLLAFAYMSGVINHAEKERFLSFAGPGFRDFTRIAASEPTLWRDVFIANKEEMLVQISDFKNMLTQYEAILQKNSYTELLELLQTTSQGRLAWQQPNELINTLAPPSDSDHGKGGFFSRIFG